MPTFVAKTYISPRFREAHFEALKQGGQLPEDIASHVEAHLEYVKDLVARGKSICNGPTVAFTWGLNVVRADSLEEAKSIIENDPGMKSGLLTHYEIEPWYHIN